MLSTTQKVNERRLRVVDRTGEARMHLLNTLIRVVGASAHRHEVAAALAAVSEAEYEAGRYEAAASVGRVLERIFVEPHPGAEPVAASGPLVELARKVVEAYPHMMAAQVMKELREDAVKGTTRELVAKVVAADALQWAMDMRQAVKA